MLKSHKSSELAPAVTTKRSSRSLKQNDKHNIYKCQFAHPHFKKMYSLFSGVFIIFCFFFNPPLLTSAADPSPVWGTVQLTDGSHRRDPSLLEFSMNPPCTNKSVRNNGPFGQLSSPVFFFTIIQNHPECDPSLCSLVREVWNTHIMLFLYSWPIIITLYPRQTDAWGGGMGFTECQKSRRKLLGSLQTLETRGWCQSRTFRLK